MDSPWRNGVPHGGKDLTNVRDGEKWCNGCQQWRGLEWFQRDAHCKSGRKANCRTCCTAQASRRRAAQRYSGQLTPVNDKPMSREVLRRKRRRFADILGSNDMTRTHQLFNQLRRGYRLTLFKRRTWLLTSPDGGETTRPRADLCRRLVSNLWIEEATNTGDFITFRVSHLGQQVK